MAQRTRPAGACGFFSRAASAVDILLSPKRRVHPCPQQVDESEPSFLRTIFKPTNVAPGPPRWFSRGGRVKTRPRADREKTRPHADPAAFGGARLTPVFAQRLLFT
ncbi:hypothetical protein M885DRAFT_559727 [Pelagophyceae sp. CCMP2097]|nr:hypothetical protein M885DRAFT_559727 [Pelagophyceae sp. CCMP2097]